MNQIGPDQQPIGKDLAFFLFFAPWGKIRRPVIVLHDAQCRADHVVKLAILRHVQKHPDRDEYDYDAERDEEV